MLFPGMFGIPKQAARRNGNGSRTTNTMSIVNQPSRRNVTMNSAGGMQVVIDDELTSLTIPLDGTDVGSIESISVSPDATDLWPKLYSKAQTFSNYTVLKLQFNYVPCAGTANNGTLWYGFHKDMSIDAASAVGTAQLCEGLDLHGAISVSQPYSFDVPVDKMNQGGKGLIINSSESKDPGSMPLYFPGNFYYGTSNVSGSATTVGQFRTRYVIRLEAPKMQTKPATSLVSYDPTDGIEVMRKGYISLRRNGAVGEFTSSFNVSCATTFTAILRLEHGETVSITANGTPVVPDDTFVGATYDLQFYTFQPCRNVLIDVTMGTATGLIQFDRCVVGKDALDFSS